MMPSTSFPADIPTEKYKSIVAAFPTTGFQEGAIKTLTQMAATKPDVVYYNFIEPFGTAYVPGFNATGEQGLDRITSGYVPS